MQAHPTQLSLFDDIARASVARSPARPLVLMACSATKLDRPAPAMDLYRGVMYETFRAHVRADAQPQVIILSAQHGFIQPDAEIAPYDARMTADRAETMLSDLSTAMAGAAWPDQVGLVFLAGGMHYRRVMRAAVERWARTVSAAPTIMETSGGIGMQRSQLGQYLDGLTNEPSEEIGRFPNGVLCFRRAGPFTVGERDPARSRTLERRFAFKQRSFARRARRVIGQ
ncbi:DUF6884 domain-containing protein [Cupriavidus sp. D39]|uniref:DUF6884 domain-containing protein n=1 Tax=Cupriavidus sp. D39 TaxID=2997877 RepID=UPI002271467F|nr:DUF6884 domain-containing protein [Cupriavidus sp. D39]MCY0853905.1 hypothetical protein [Cupriavidus sp. D39]